MMKQNSKSNMHKTIIRIFKNKEVKSNASYYK